MAGEMTRTERVMAALEGEPVDRVPVSAWWHEWDREWSATDVAAATLESYRKYGWDYIKVNPRFTYYAEDWGTIYEAFPDRAPVIRTRAVESSEDLQRLKAVTGTGGVFGEQIEALRLIEEGLKGEAPFIQTAFTPLAVMMVMTGSPRFVRKLMQEHPVELEGALAEIERTMLSGEASEVAAEATGAIEETGGSRFLLGPGCSIDPETPEANLRALAEAAR